MKLFVVIIFSLSVCTQGCAQVDSINNNKDENMVSKFDIKDFYTNSDEAGFYKYVAYGKSVVKRVQYNNNFKVIGFIMNSECLYTPYRYYYKYDKQGNLLHSVDFFDSFPIREECYYDTLGHVTKTIDHDKPYKFSLDDLIKKMKEEYGCDILDKGRLIKVYRSEGKNDLHKPWYEVCCLEDTSVYYCNRYLIDGTTGETLYMEKHENVMDDDLDGMRLYRAIKAGKPITIQDEYLYELKKKKGGQDEKGTKKKGKSFWRKLFD